MCSVSKHITSSGVSNSIVSSVSNFYCSKLVIVLYVSMCLCCNKGCIKKNLRVMT